MKKFHQWLKLRESGPYWHDYQASQGNFQPSYNPGPGGAGAPLKSISDDENLQKSLWKGTDDHRDGVTKDKDMITDIKMLHDRILDSEKVKDDDFVMFMKTILDSVPRYDGSWDDYMVQNSWDMVLYELGERKGGFNKSTINDIERAFKYTLEASRDKSRVGEYYREVLPLIRNILKVIKYQNSRYQASSLERRTAIRAIHARRT